MAKRPEKTTRS